MTCIFRNRNEGDYKKQDGKDFWPSWIRLLFIGNEISLKMILSSCEDSSDTDEEESARLKEAVLGNISLNLGTILSNYENSREILKPHQFYRYCFYLSYILRMLQKGY